MGLIYSITSPSGGIYIGKTVNLKDRLRKYRNGAQKSQRIIFNSILKYGWDNHVFNVIAEVSDEQLAEAEKEAIVKYNSFKKYNPKGMNLTMGGEGILGLRHTRESKLKMSKNSTGKKHTAETLKKISIGTKGRPIPANHPFKVKGYQDGELNARWGKGLVPVLQYSMEGEFIKEYKSIKEAGLALTIGTSKISAVCSGRQKSGGGFVFKYKNERGDVPANRVPVICFFNNYTIEYSCANKAAEDIGVSIKTISRIANRGVSTSKGLFFEKLQRNQLN